MKARVKCIGHVILKTLNIHLFYTCANIEINGSFYQIYMYEIQEFFIHNLTTINLRVDIQ